MQRHKIDILMRPPTQNFAVLIWFKYRTLETQLNFSIHVITFCPTYICFSVCKRSHFEFPSFNF